MTVCIAAITDNGWGVVTASDRTISRSDLLFPEATPKVEAIGIAPANNCVALFSGTTGYEGEVLRACRTDKYLPVEKHFENVKTAVSGVCARLVKEQVLRPRSLPDDFQPLTEPNIAPEYRREIADEILYVSTRIDFIVAGVDDTGAHLFFVDGHGTGLCADSGGYIAIGSGAHYAEASLARYQYHRSYSIDKAMYLVYEAKKRAEAAPNIGRLVDMTYMMKSTGGVTGAFLEEAAVARLAEIYQAVDEKEQEAHAGVVSELTAEGGVFRDLFPDPPEEDAPQPEAERD